VLLGGCRAIQVDDDGLLLTGGEINRCGGRGETVLHHDDFDMTCWYRERADALRIRLLRRSIDDDVGVTNRTRLGSHFNADPCRRLLTGGDSRMQQTEHRHDQTTHRPPTEID
jgi:hypothetical protein